MKNIFVEVYIVNYKVIFIIQFL